MPTMTAQECVSLQEQVKQWDVPAREKDLVLRALQTLLVLFQKLSTLQMTIKELRTMFHIKTEKKENLYPATAPVLDRDEHEAQNKDESESSQSTSPTPRRKKKRKGHGRRGASAYTGAKEIFITHETLSPGDPCPGCHSGKLYDYTGPGFIRIEATPPLQATKYRQQKLRCATCNDIYPATVSEEVAVKMSSKWSPSARSMVTLLKYGYGFPYHRLAELQHDLGVPVPSSTQWDVAASLADQISPVYQALCERAAQGQVMFNDDTFARIIKLAPPNLTGHASDRTGIFTTGIVSQVGTQTIYLYYTGRNHAGENMTDLLNSRDSDRDPPILMCDAASRNNPKEKEVVLAHCLVHGRRKFVQTMSAFPDPSHFVINSLALVFKHDKEARRNGYTDSQRLAYHQDKSKPIMKKLKAWMEDQFEQRLVEPESSLGKAFQYMLKHWTEMTRFLKIEGAPLHSNIVERALKKAILHRKNAYFFRTKKGAMVSDLMMSLIETCRRSGGDPFHYLTALQQHSTLVRENPEHWLPWNYRNNAEKISNAA